MFGPALIHTPKPESLLPNRCFTDRYAADDSLLRGHLELRPIQRLAIWLCQSILVKVFRCEEELNEIDHRASRGESVVILMTQSCRFQIIISRHVSDLTDVWAFAFVLSSAFFPVEGELKERRRYCGMSSQVKFVTSGLHHPSEDELAGNQSPAPVPSQPHLILLGEGGLIGINDRSIWGNETPCLRQSGLHQSSPAIAGRLNPVNARVLEVIAPVPAAMHQHMSGLHGFLPIPEGHQGS